MKKLMCLLCALLLAMMPAALVPAAASEPAKL